MQVRIDEFRTKPRVFFPGETEHYQKNTGDFNPVHDPTRKNAAVPGFSYMVPIVEAVHYRLEQHTQSPLFLTHLHGNFRKPLRFGVTVWGTISSFLCNNKLGEITITACRAVTEGGEEIARFSNLIFRHPNVTRGKKDWAKFSAGVGGRVWEACRDEWPDGVLLRSIDIDFRREVRPEETVHITYPEEEINVSQNGALKKFLVRGVSNVGDVVASYIVKCLPRTERGNQG